MSFFNFSGTVTSHVPRWTSAAWKGSTRGEVSGALWLALITGSWRCNDSYTRPSSRGGGCLVEKLLSHALIVRLAMAPLQGHWATIAKRSLVSRSGVTNYHYEIGRGRLQTGVAGNSDTCTWYSVLAERLHAAVRVIVLGFDVECGCEKVSTWSATSLRYADSRG